MRVFFLISYVHETMCYYFLNTPHCLTDVVRSNINIYSTKEKRCDLSTTEMAPEDLAGILAYNSIDVITGSMDFLGERQRASGPFILVACRFTLILQFCETQ